MKKGGSISIIGDLAPEYFTYQIMLPADRHSTALNAPPTTSYSQFSLGTRGECRDGRMRSERERDVKGTGMRVVLCSRLRYPDPYRARCLFPTSTTAGGCGGPVPDYFCYHCVSTGSSIVVLRSCTRKLYEARVILHDFNKRSHRGKLLSLRHKSNCGMYRYYYSCFMLLYITVFPLFV